MSPRPDRESRNFDSRRRGNGRKTMKKFSFLIVMIVLIVGGFGAWWINGTSPADPANTTRKNFEIAKGLGVRQVANNLKEQGLIKDPVVFFLFLKQQGLDGKVQAGDFVLAPSMNASEIAQALQVGTSDIHVTIPEGKRADEIADILQKNLPNYKESWRAQLVAQEGYLFPDTYSFPKDADIDTVIKTMKDTFDKKYASIPQTGNKYTQAQTVIIASMVEREAKFEVDRPLVASVIENRMAINMPLQIDATIQYAIGTESNWWPTLQDSGSNVAPTSPYNTYTKPGLPPTPISNPGLNVLKAVVQAPTTDYIYYVSDKQGHNHYTHTLEEHNANIKKYL